MSDDPTTQANPEPQPTPEPQAETSEQAAVSLEDSWREVGRQFENLGRGIADAFRAAGKTEQAVEMRDGLETMISDIGKAIREAAESPQGQKVREETNRTVEVLRTAGETTVREARPQVISALKQLNDELQKLVNKIEKD
jgi:chaperonin cofactor prefoldin